MYIHSFISFQIDEFEFDLKRNSLGKTGIYEYLPFPQLATNGPEIMQSH